MECRFFQSRRLAFRARHATDIRSAGNVHQSVLQRSNNLIKWILSKQQLVAAETPFLSSKFFYQFPILSRKWWKMMNF